MFCYCLLILNFVALCSANGFDILSKFHQNEYKIKDFRIETGFLNKSITNKFSSVTFKYNRTLAVANLTFNFKVDVEDQMMVVVQFLKKASNEYRGFPIRYQISMNSAVNSNAAGLQAILKCGNLTRMYFVKDVTYRFCNFFIDETQLPPLIPVGQYKVLTDFLHLNRILATLDVFMEIYVPFKYPTH